MRRRKFSDSRSFESRFGMAGVSLRLHRPVGGSTGSRNVLYNFHPLDFFEDEPNNLSFIKEMFSVC